MNRIRNPTEALVREGIQNSLDAGTGSPVKVRLFLASGNNVLAAIRIAPWLHGAWEHLHAAGNGHREPPGETTLCPFIPRTRLITALHLRPEGAGRTAKDLLLHFCLTIGHKGQPLNPKT